MNHRLLDLIKTIALFFLVTPLAIAVPVGSPIIPSSVDPGTVGKILSTQQPYAGNQANLPSLPPPQKEEVNKLGPEAAKITFKLKKIIIEGNHIYTEQQLLPLYQNKLNTTISVSDLEALVDNITDYYRNNGYILSRAVLPPQKINTGTVHIRIIEGYISEVYVQGNPKKAKCMVQAYGNNIKADKPLNVDTMTYYLHLANEVPGLDVKSVLEASKTETGGTDLTLIANEKSFNAYISYDNYGTLYLGPDQVTGSVSGNSIFHCADSTHLTLVRTTWPNQMRFIDISHDTPLNCNGIRGTIGGNGTTTRPGLNLAKVDTAGNAVNYYASALFPIIRETDSDLTLTFGVNYINSALDNNISTVYNDHIRSAKFGFNYDITDSHDGSNSMSVFLEQGFPILGASTNPNSPIVSQHGADGVYSKFSGFISRLQHIYSRYSAYAYLTGQYSFNPLLVTPQFAYGGSQLGRGYDPAEITGDSGIGGTFELRMDNAPDWYFLQTLQIYAFYDAGAIWDIKDIPFRKSNQSATSTGAGLRFTLFNHFSGNLMLGQPLTKQVFDLQAGHRNSRALRGFFSLTASV